MPQAGRLGDNAQVPSDSHGCICCAHSCIGPATTGSQDVHVNERLALRIQDTGVHSSCCGPNTWVAVAGAPHVLINGRKAHRLTDVTQHCGGVGQLVGGSSDVIIGDEGGGGSESQFVKTKYDEAFVLLDEDTGKPVADQSYRIIRADGQEITGKTDKEGRTVLLEADEAESIRIEVVDEHDEDAFPSE